MCALLQGRDAVLFAGLTCSPSAHQISTSIKAPSHKLPDRSCLPYGNTPARLNNNPIFFPTSFKSHTNCAFHCASALSVPAQLSTPLQKFCSQLLLPVSPASLQATSPSPPLALRTFLEGWSRISKDDCSHIRTVSVSWVSFWGSFQSFSSILALPTINVWCHLKVNRFFFFF